MDIKDIKRIIELMKANELSEFELEEEGFRIAIKRRNGEIQQVVGPIGSAAPAAPVAAPAPAAALAPVPTAAAADQEAGLVKITSPMVGTFYRSSAPDSEAFASVGKEVDEETVVCIIEAMKVMNEIKAETRGIVRKILVENATSVEYGQALFLIEPT
jgi:acetyl-CoA carboxylase biotin carboxyl carrier protein